MKESKSLFKNGRSLWTKGKADEATKVFRKASQLSLEKGLKKESELFEAAIANIEQKVEQALKKYLALASAKSFLLRGHAFFLAGSAYSDKKQYDKAIECYEKALKEKTYDTPGKTWNNMGIAYRNKKQYDKAIECYEKALKEKTCDTPGITWSNMGSAYSDKKQYDKAIECYEKAKSWAEQEDAESMLNLAKIQISLAKKDRSKETKSDIRKEVSEFLQHEEALTTEAEQAIEPEQEIAKIFDTFDTVAAEYSAEPDSGLNNVLVVLKGWSSSIPGFSYTYPQRFSNTECLGGGYFLKWRGKGIVIDPGTHFLRNFTSINSGQPYLFADQRIPNFHIREIDLVLTTHNHPDHTYDLPMLADQICQYNQQVAKANRKDVLYLLDEDTYTDHKDKLARSYTSGNTPRHLHPSTTHEDLLERFSIKLDVFHTEHDKNLAHSVGLVISLFEEGAMKYKIGITSDTKYMSILPNFFRDCDAVFLHFSSLRLAEFRGKKQSPRRLGYIGTRKIIQKTKAPLFVVAEFWGGKGDIRFPVIKKLRQVKNDDDKVVIGGDIGLMLKMPDGLVRCSRCGTWISPKMIQTPRPARDYETLRYLCPNCIS